MRSIRFDGAWRLRGPAEPSREPGMELDMEAVGIAIFIYLNVYGWPSRSVPERIRTANKPD